MAKADDKDFRTFLKAFDKEKAELALTLREFVWDLYPQTNELIYDNYNALVTGWSITDRLGHTFCSVGIFRANNRIHFGFYWGNEIADPQKKLLGQGNQYRYLLVEDLKTFPKAYIKKLVREAYANSLGKVKDERDIKEGLTLVKSVVAKKRPPSRAQAGKKSSR